MKGIVKILILVMVVFGLYGLFKPLPPGVNVEYPIYNVRAEGIHFYEDLSYVNVEGKRFSDQEIFDQIFNMIDGASNYILIDMFLFNDYLGTETESYRGLSGELVDKLVTKKQRNSNLPIVLITDPINDIYGGLPSKQLDQLREAGVVVVVTNLKALRDSNPLYSGFYRAFIQWFDNAPDEKGILSNPFDASLPKLGVRTYLEMLNFKANHRKVVIADSSTLRGVKMKTLVTSANPHDGSSAHTNIAIVVDDFIWKDVLESEKVVGLFSGVDIPMPDPVFLKSIVDEKGNVFVQLLIEKRIREKIITEIKNLRKEDTLDIAMFYLSDRQVIRELKAADKRNVKIRLLLDPNKDAFGREKNGIPNRPVAYELLKDAKNLEIRWCDTHGEQCHTKMLLITSNGIHKLIMGSANITRRNIGGFNLETNIFIESKETIVAMSEARNYFEMVWNNTQGKVYSTDYQSYEDSSLMRRILYRFMEALGTGSF